MRNLFITTLLCVLSFSVQAQFFQFSQRSFTPQRVNPAMVGGSDYAHAFLNFRNQTTAGDFSLLSTALDLSYPVSWGGTRRGGVGVYFMDDRAGSQGIFSRQEAGFSSAISIPTGKLSSVNLGLGIGYQRNSFDLSGLSTGAQFVPNRGFDSSLSNGEGNGDLNTNIVRWNAGLYWRNDAERGVLKSYFGIAAFDLNQADESLTGAEVALPISLVAEGGLMINRTSESILYAEAFAFGADNTYSVQAGVMLEREISRDQDIQLRARYSSENFVMLGAMIQKDNFQIGASYDLALGGSSVANQSAFEVGLGWVFFVEPKGRKKRRKRDGDPEPRARPRPRPQPELELPVDSIAEAPAPVVPDTTVVTPPTPVETEVKIGEPKSEPKVVDEYQVRLPFRFNSAALSPQFEQFLDEVITRLEANENLIVQIIGHTDSVGSEEVNQQISEARAQSAADYLTAKGIAKDRIVVEGKGELEPIGSNETREGRALNRRVEVKILEKE